MASYNEPSPVLSTSVSCSNNDSIPPGENDVIIGIGCNSHKGNMKFRQFIKAYKRARYRTNPTIAAAKAVEEVVTFWRKLSPRGRFLARRSNGQWQEVEDKQAMKIASFFLLNPNAGAGAGQGGRPKSTEAIKESQSQLQAPPQVREQAQCQSKVHAQFQGQVHAQFQGQLLSQSQVLPQGQAVSQGQNQGMRQFQGQSMQSQPQTQAQLQDDWASLEPVPIGPMSATSMGWGEVSKKPRPQGPVKSFQEPVPSLGPAKADQDFEPFDFNPIPLQFKDDDFDPLPSNFGFSSSMKNGGCGSGPLDLPTNSLYSSAPEKVQVSVNMVVNTVPQGYQRENAVNTVTNIQIGTINDDRNKGNTNFSNSYGDSFPVSNFQTNGFIQISTQSNAPAVDDRLTMNPGFSGGQHQMNDFQGGFFSDDNVNGIASSVPGQVGRSSASSGFDGYSGNNGMPFVNNGMPFVNNGMPFASNSNGGNNVASANLNGINNSNNNSGQDGLRWNKNKVASSVPCAASLVGSIFDEW